MEKTEEKQKIRVRDMNWLAKVGVIGGVGVLAYILIAFIVGLIQGLLSK